MRRIYLSLLLFFVFSAAMFAQQYRRPVKPTKNLIVMIPDGTSIGVVSAARWYQIYNKLGGDNLAIDPYLCGTVKTFSSNAPIGDSAPTTSCYMTGMPQRSGNVSIYPEADPEKDLVPVDPEMAYQPLSTILEAAKYQQNKATGLVVTVEFPHATPADCSAHHYARGRYDYIGSQMAYQNLDVMFGGGNSILTDDIKEHFKNTGTKLFQNDIKAFKEFNGKEKVWALFGERELPYDLDRDPNIVPSLQEMTEKALDRLSQNENGFFLMVEGSKIDWSAHGNDAVGCITEYLAFDKAVASVMEFAKKNGETTVVIMPDHGNSGFTIGRRDLKGYDKASLSDLFKNVSKFKKTGEGLERILLKSKPEDFKAIFKKYTDIDLNEEELNLLLSSKNYKEADYMKVSNSVNMGSSIINIMDSHTYFGFTTGGHTGEEVFLAAYHPNGDIPVGMNTNVEINHYLRAALGLSTSLEEMTSEIFAKHTDVFKGMEYTIDKSTDFPVLKVKKGNTTLTIPAFKSVVYLNNQPIALSSVVVYIDKNDTFYLPKSLANKL
ncbi:alkaline phosphatase [Dysgonomonas sp. Marseille-P4677]|uniref:alkaline phosphatase n=1 Tax=Dysgonomonas sp. Marseille-P4677 TaxID=2364790 RepID=UPI0019126EA6|nr:alkaline phosphatase [Dysgonomonas sp. Marseille-P4677]MBK5719986.1 alkaline phosphatase [Dysgonomonas sp. Marseille-P4677]